MPKELEEHREKVFNTAHLYHKIDAEVIPLGKDEVRLFVIARNEELRLPYFLNYYFNLGVDRIFLIDNNSTDKTREIAISRKKTHVFKIDESFKDFWYWIEYFLEEYGKNRWCVVADVDELLFYPHGEHLGLKELIKYFESNQFTALKCLLLDMYSELPIIDTKYQTGENPLKICPYFDAKYYIKDGGFLDKKHWIRYNSDIFIGGVRQRIFGRTKNQNWEFCLSKIPIFKHSEKTYLNEGMHAINGASMADLRGVVFHTKFMHDFIHEAQEESEREVTWQNGAEYKIYNFHLSQSPNLILKNNESIKFENSNQLIQYGLMETSPKFENYSSYKKIR